MRKPTNEYTDEEIMTRLRFARRIIAAKQGTPISPTLEAERLELLSEMEARSSAPQPQEKPTGEQT